MHRGILATALAGVATTLSAQTPDPVADYASGRRLGAIAERCGGLPAVEAAALSASTDQRRDDLPADRWPAAESAAVAARAAAQTVDCRTKDGQGLVAEARAVASRQAILWLARADAAATLARQASWADPSSRLVTLQPAIAATRQAFDRRDAQVASQARAMAARDAQLIATILCAATTPRPSGCPAAQVPAPAIIAQARAYQARLEAFARVAAAAAPGIARPAATTAGRPALPPGVNRWPDVLAVRAGLSDLEAGSTMIGTSLAVSCATGDLVVVLDGPPPTAPLAPAVRGRVYRLPAPNVLAEVSVFRGPFVLQVLSTATLPGGIPKYNSLRPCLP